jgi:von Willebrand factor type A domain
MRDFVLFCVLGIFVGALVGCGEPAKPDQGARHIDIPVAANKEPPSKDAAKDKSGKDKDKGGKDRDGHETVAVPGDLKGDDSSGPPPPATKPAMDEPRVGLDKPVRDRPDTIPPGVLTAGAFDDNLYPHFFRSFAGKVGQNPYVSNLPGRFLGRRLEIRVRNGQGAPVGNARVRVAPPNGQAVELTTRTDGRAIFLSSWDHLSGEGELEVMAAQRGDDNWVKQVVGKEVPDCTVILQGAAAPLPRNLDLAIVLDTTGSMGDELRYLKTEIKSIAAGIRAQFPEVNQRYALVVYRDENMGDEYVTRVFNFTSNIDEFQRNLAAQSAAGGGDLPEAMQRGLEQATRLQWREGDTARVLFLVADAPPHARDGARTLECVDILRKKGVAVYPVAASCSDPPATEATEFYMRAAALLTGAQYLFLTDDSGVGEGHVEPHIPYYRVEKLNRLMSRMIGGELSGRRNEPRAEDVLRTMGRPPRSGRQD